MKKSLIRHLAASRGARVAAALFARTVSIWDVRTGEQISEFDTVLDFGGTRLLLDKSGERCVAAAYHVHGIACYSTADGALLWRRKDLKKAQHLTLSRDGERVFCGFSGRPCAVLDIHTGHEVEKLRGVRAVYESPFKQVRLVDQSRPELQTPGRKSIERRSFAFLDVAFSPDSICISESGGTVRCIDTRQAKEIWSQGPPPDDGVELPVFLGTDCNFVSLGYSRKAGAFFGVGWPYVFGGARILKRFEQKTGNPETIASVGEPAETIFCLGGDYLLTSLGQLIDVSNGKTVRELPFERVRRDRNRQSS